MAQNPTTAVRAENVIGTPAERKLCTRQALRKASLNLGSSHSFFRVLGITSFLIVLATFAFAHAVLVESSPAPDSTVPGPNVEIVLKFNERIDVGRSRLELVAAGGVTRFLPVRAGRAANIMLARATDLTPGKYTLIWQVLATDGHITRGETAFSVR